MVQESFKNVSRLFQAILKSVSDISTMLVDKMQRQYSTEERGRFPTVFVAIATIIFAVVVIMALVLPYFYSRYSYYPHPMYPGFMAFPMLIMFPIMIIVIVAIGLIVYRGFRWGGCCGGTSGHYGHYDSDEEKETAMEILRRRYAKGEITKEQFEQRAPVLNVLIELEKQGEVSSEEVKEEASKD